MRILGEESILLNTMDGTERRLTGKEDFRLYCRFAGLGSRINVIIFNGKSYAA